MPNESDACAWLRLALGEHARGRLVGARLAAALGSPHGVLRASRARLERLIGADRARDRSRAWRAARPAVVMQRAHDLGQEVLTPASASWPAAAFAALEDPPCALFLQGSMPGSPGPTGDAGTTPGEGTSGEAPAGPVSAAPAAGVVGTRDATAYALAFARVLAADLARAGVWVVSGFALGVDGAAHRGAVDAGAPTLAVLGCGVDHPYPVAHGDLRDELVACGGGLVSEHPPGVEPRKYHFPRRNRIVAALVQALVVVEAPARSGALITARFALEHGRDILSVPGNVGQRGRAGCHQLLRDGATLCESAADVLEVMGVPLKECGTTEHAPALTGDEALLWRALDAATPRDAGSLCAQTGLTPEYVASTLVGLELAGRVRRIPGQGYLQGR